jgi:hypothetical protein
MNTKQTDNKNTKSPRFKSPIRRFPLVAALLAFSVVTLVFESAALANTVYNIVNYPYKAVDNTSGNGIITISGTIITDGKTGTLDFSNIIGGTMTLSTTNRSVTGPFNYIYPFGPLYGVTATSSQLLQSPLPGDGSGYSCFYPIFGPTQQGTGIFLYYGHCASGNQSFECAEADSIYGGNVIQGFSVANPPNTQGSIGASNPWVIANGGHPTGGSTSPIPLNIRLITNNVVLSWNDPSSVFTLQAAPTVNGVFANVPGATNPYTNAITGTQQYFRLLAPAN